MHIESLLLRNLSGRRDSDQIVREPDRSTGIDGDAAGDELTHRPLDPADVPAVQLGRIAKGQRTAGNCQQREYSACVPTRTTESRGHEPTGVDLRSGSLDKRFEPKRGTTRPHYELSRGSLGKARLQHPDKLERLAARQRPKLQTPEALWR